MNEQETIQFLRQAAKIALSYEKKQTFRDNLLVFMEKKPLSQKQKGVFLGHFFDIFTVKRFVSSGMIAVLIVLLAGGGVSFAAEKALPGEILYPVKRNINEPAREVFALTSQAKADWAVEQTKRRISEAEELSVQGKLNETNQKDIEESASRSAEKASELVRNFETHNNTKKAHQVEKNLNEALRGGKKIHAERFDNKIIIHEGEQDVSEKQTVSGKKSVSSEKQNVSEKQDGRKQDELGKQNKSERQNTQKQDD